MLKLLFFTFLLLTVSNCNKIQGERLDLQIKEAQQCKESSDCVLLGMVCSIGCNIYVNKDGYEELLVKVQTFNKKENCRFKCSHLTPGECFEGQCRQVPAL